MMISDLNLWFISALSKGTFEERILSWSQHNGKLNEIDFSYIISEIIVLDC